MWKWLVINWAVKNKSSGIFRCCWGWSSCLQLVQRVGISLWQTVPVLAVLTFPNSTLCSASQESLEAFPVLRNCSVQKVLVTRNEQFSWNECSVSSQYFVFLHWFCCGICCGFLSFVLTGWDKPRIYFLEKQVLCCLSKCAFGKSLLNTTWDQKCCLPYQFSELFKMEFGKVLLSCVLGILRCKYWEWDFSRVVWFRFSTYPLKFQV